SVAVAYYQQFSLSGLRYQDWPRWPANHLLLERSRPRRIRHPQPGGCHHLSQFPLHLCQFLGGGRNPFRGDRHLPCLEHDRHPATHRAHPGAGTFGARQRPAQASVAGRGAIDADHYPLLIHGSLPSSKIGALILWPASFWNAWSPIKSSAHPSERHVMHAVSSATMAFGCADERILSTLGAICCHLFDVCGVSLPTLCRPCPRCRIGSDTLAPPVIVGLLARLPLLYPKVCARNWGWDGRTAAPGGQTAFHIDQTAHHELRPVGCTAGDPG